MKKKLAGLLVYFAVLVTLIGAWGGLASAQSPKRELRGAWIATVKNIDWPSRGGLTVEVQQEELLTLLDTLENYGINAIFLQIRPSGEVFYPSRTEPWSQWLTGEQGRAPQPYYDPLAFAIEAAHARNMEFHAWINPFRADLDWTPDKVLATNHVGRLHPGWCVAYGRNLYLDPGWPEVRRYVIDQVLDVARRYEVDAIHFDDYFYPYQIAGQEFPDSLSFGTWGSPMAERGDWRRDNINQFIHGLRDSLLALDPSIQFGISPFGVWRNEADDPRGSPTRAGQTSYDALYADVRLWLERGWIDYIVPQLYFSIGYAPAAFDRLLDWWTENTYGRRLYIGHSPYKVGQNSDRNWDQPEQLPLQVRLTRQHPEVLGSAWFSARWFALNPLGFADSLRQNYYRQPALIPPLDYLGQTAPPRPVDLGSRSQAQGVEVQWKLNRTGSTAYYAIYRKKGTKAPSLEAKYLYALVSAEEVGLFIDEQTRFLRRYSYRITALNRAHLESEGSLPVVQRRWSGLFQRER